MTSQDYEQFISWLYQEIEKIEEKIIMAESPFAVDDNFDYPYWGGYRDALQKMRHKLEMLPAENDAKSGFYSASAILRRQGNL